MCVGGDRIVVDKIFRDVIISCNVVLYKKVKVERVDGVKLVTDGHRWRFWFSHGKVAASSKPDCL